MRSKSFYGQRCMQDSFVSVLYLWVYSFIKLFFFYISTSPRSIHKMLIRESHVFELRVETKFEVQIHDFDVSTGLSCINVIYVDLYPSFTGL